ncbi:hypothetical protein HY995_01140 [Candidatus Micrarchaeota archaeon]|nr:hypothetical protein [Candidatus Micrarchaeota archaeon]
MLSILAITDQPLPLVAIGAGILAVLAVALLYVRFRSLLKIQSELSDSWGKIDYLLLKRAQLLKNMLRASGKLSTSSKRAVESAKSAWDAIMQARTSREKAVAVTLALEATDAIVEYARSTGSDDTQIFRRYVEEVQLVDRQAFALLSFYDSRAEAYLQSLSAFPFSEASIQSALGLRHFDKFNFNPEAPPQPVAREEFGVSVPAVSIEPTSMAQVQSDYSQAVGAFAQSAAGSMQQPQPSGRNAAGAAVPAFQPAAVVTPVPSEAVEEKPPVPKRPAQAEADEQDASLWRKIHEMQSQQEQAALAVSPSRPQPEVSSGIPPYRPEVSSGVSLSQSQPEYSFGGKRAEMQGNVQAKGEAAFEKENPAASASPEPGSSPETPNYQSPLAEMIRQRISEPAIQSALAPEAQEAQRPAAGRPAFKEEFAPPATPSPAETAPLREEHNPFPVKREVLKGEAAQERRAPPFAAEFSQSGPNQQSPPQSQPPSPYPTPPQNYPQGQYPIQPTQPPYPQPPQYPPAQQPYPQQQYPAQPPSPYPGPPQNYSQQQYPPSQSPYPQQQFPSQQPPQYPPQAPPFQPPAYPPAAPPPQYYPPQQPQYPQYPPVQPQYPQQPYPQTPQYPQPYQPPQAPPWVSQPEYPRPPIYLQQPPQYPPQPAGQAAVQQYPQTTQQPSSRQSPPQQTPLQQYPPSLPQNQQASPQNQQPPSQDNLAPHPIVQAFREPANAPNVTTPLPQDAPQQKKRGEGRESDEDGETEMY